MRGTLTGILLIALTACEFNVDVKVDAEEEPTDTAEPEEEACTTHIEVDHERTTWDTNVTPGQASVQFARMTIEVQGDVVTYHPTVTFDGPLVLQEHPILTNIHLVDESGGSWTRNGAEMDLNGEPSYQQVHLPAVTLPDGQWLMDLTADISEEAFDGDEITGSISFLHTEEAPRFTSNYNCDLTGLERLNTVNGPTMTVRR